MASTYEKRLRSKQRKAVVDAFSAGEPYQIVPHGQWFTIIGPDGMLMGFVPAKNPKRYDTIVKALNAAYARGKSDALKHFTTTEQP